MIRRLTHDEKGSALITALLATMLMLGLGFALLSIVDTQASESSRERSRDRAFNLSETLLTSEAFVLGRNWPSSAPAGACKTTGGFDDALGNPAPAATPEAARLRRNLDSNYDPAVDSAYAGAVWQIHLCDDNDADGAGPLAGSTVWDDALLNNSAADVNANNKLWVHAQSTVQGRTRAVVGLVRARTKPALNARYGLVAGGLADDLGASLNTITNQGVLGKTLSANGIGLLDTTPTVATDPTAGAPTPNGITGVRCGALDLKDGSTCVTGTVGAAGAIPLVSDLVTGGSVENFPSKTSTSDDNIARLRAQARASGTYTPVSAGTAPVGSGTLLNPTDTAPAAPATVAACTLTGSPTASSVVFIEQVGDTGTANSIGGPGDQYCSIDVGLAKQYKAIIVASGRIVIRGDNTTTASTNTAVNTFKGVIYALNLQRLPVADGGHGLGDAAEPGREVVRIDRGAHVRGAVNADGKSGKVGIYPPPITISTTTLINSLIPCTVGLGAPVCTLRDTITSLSGGVLDTAVALLQSLGAKSDADIAGAILTQAGPQRTNYGSAITADVAAINVLTVPGASNVVPGSFRDLQTR